MPRTMIELTGNDLERFLYQLKAAEQMSGEVLTIRLDMRRTGVAIKINEYEWSPTRGRIVEMD